MTEELKNLVVHRAGSVELREAAVRGGYQPIEIDGMAKVAAGLTTIEEVLRVLGT